MIFSESGEKFTFLTENTLLLALTKRRIPNILNISKIQIRF